jgi:hypothetical protein
MAVKLKTDAEGKFRAEGLLPGLKYHLVVSDGELKPGKVVAYHIEELLPESGMVKDLGDLKSTLSPDQEGKEKE